MNKTILVLGVLVFIVILAAFGRLGGCDVCGKYTNPATGDPLEIKKDGTFYSEDKGTGMTGDWKKEGNRITFSLPFGYATRGEIKDRVIVVPEYGEVYIKAGVKPPQYKKVVGRYLKDPDEYLELSSDGKYYRKEKVFGMLAESSGDWELKDHRVELISTYKTVIKGAVFEDKIYFSGSGLSPPDIWVKTK